MSKLLAGIFLTLILMAPASYGKTPHETIIGKYEFVEDLTFEMPEYKYIPITDGFKQETKFLVDSELEITENDISWKLYSGDIIKEKHTLKYENIERGEVELLLKTKGDREWIISIEILDDKYIAFRPEKGAPPYVFIKVLEFNESSEKAKRRKEFELEVANQTAEVTLSTAGAVIASYFATPLKDNAFDMESLKKEGLDIPDDVSLEILNNKMDSFILVCTHKQGDTKFILHANYEITSQKILEENEILSIVKNGVFPNFPEKNLNQAANKFLGDPSWKVIEANDGRYYVNLKGTFSVDNEPAKALLQLKVDTTNKSFTATAFEINGEFQNESNYLRFIDAMFK